MKKFLTSIGCAGSISSAVAAAAPCCLPFLASVAGTVGLSVLLPYSQYIAFFVQVFGVLAAIGAFLSFRRHGKYGPLILTVVCVVSLVIVYNVSLITGLLYFALSGLLIGALWSTYEIKRCSQCSSKV